MLVEDGEAEHGAEQSERQQPDSCRHDAEGVQHRDGERDGYDLGHRHPVEPVEEVDGVDEADRADHEQRPLDAERKEPRQDAHILRQRQHDGERRQSPGR